MIPVVTLKPGHIQPVWSGHPWVFAQAIAHVEGGALPGDEVRVIAIHGATAIVAPVPPDPTT